MMKAKYARELSNKLEILEKNKRKLENWCDVYLDAQITKRAIEGYSFLVLDIRNVPENCSDAIKIRILTEYLSENGYTLESMFHDILYRVSW